MSIRGHFISDREKAKAYFSILNLHKNLNFASRYGYMHEYFFNFFKPATMLFLTYIFICICFFMANPFFLKNVFFIPAFYCIVFAFTTHSVMLFFKIKKYFYTKLNTCLSQNHHYKEFLIFHSKNQYSDLD